MLFRSNSDIKAVNINGTEYNPNDINASIKKGGAIAITVEEEITDKDLRLTVQTFRGSIEKIEPSELGTIVPAADIIGITVTSTVYTTTKDRIYIRNWRRKTINIQNRRSRFNTRKTEQTTTSSVDSTNININPKNY